MEACETSRLATAMMAMMLVHILGRVLLKDGPRAFRLEEVRLSFEVRRNCMSSFNFVASDGVAGSGNVLLHRMKFPTVLIGSATRISLPRNQGNEGRAAKHEP